MSFTDSSHSDAKSIQKNREKPILDKQFDHVMCFGTFDIFHPGHEFYLRESQKFAQKMTIVIARDHRVFSGKGKDPIHNESSRLEIVQKSFPDTHVILGDEVDIFSPIRTLAPDLLAFGYDQRVPEDRIRELFPHIEIVRIGGYETEKWKSSIIRKMREDNMENICLIPGTGQSVKNYGNYIGLDIWTDPKLRKHTESVDCIIGHSLGATYALIHSTNPDTKFILINPLIQKKNFQLLFLSWMRFMFSEGFDMKKAISIKHWFYTMRYAYILSRIDILPLLTKIPKENLYIIRGRGDTFFCDDRAVTIARGHGFNIMEVDAGHDWNENIRDAVESIFSK